MQATRLGGMRSGARALPPACIGSHNYRVSSSTLLLTVHVRCSAYPITSHLSRSFSMLTSMSDPPSFHLRRSRARKVTRSPMEIMEARLTLLKTLIEATEGRTDLNPRQTAKLNKHVWEKAQVEFRIEAYNSSRNFAQTASADIQPTVPSKPQTTPITLSTHSMGLRSSNALAAETNTQRINTINRSVYELPARPPSMATQRPFQQSSAHVGPSIGLPIRLAPLKKTEREPIVPPSAASGGIPEPSQMYMSISAMEPQVATVPQHLLLVIDLNGTLLFRPNKHVPQHFIERPTTQQFLNYALANYSVMIWSSARPENVDRMCDKLFSTESRLKLVAVWARDRLGLTRQDSQRRVQAYKRLERVWNDAGIQARHPLAKEGKGWHQGNTVLIDDSVEKSRSEPHNFLGVSEFRGATGEDPNVLKELAEYLSIIRMQTNVSSYILRNPLVRRNPSNKPEETRSSAIKSEQRSIPPSIG